MKDEQDRFHVSPAAKSIKTVSFTAVLTGREVAEKNLSAVSALVWVARGSAIAGPLSWPLCLLWVVCNLCWMRCAGKSVFHTAALPCQHFGLGNQSCTYYSPLPFLSFFWKQWGWRHVFLKKPERAWSFEVRVFTARHIFPLEKHTLEVAHILQKERPVAFWRSSLLIYLVINTSKTLSCLEH